jgi:sugar phosphate isomerase/epimerase
MSPIPPFSRRGFILTSASGLLSTQSLLAKTKGETWQIGCFTRPWADFDVLTSFDAMAKAGFHYLGLMTTAPENRLVISVSTQEKEAARIGREAKSRGLIILSVYGGGFRLSSRSRLVSRACAG